MATPKTKPIVLLIPGMWHTPEVFDALRTEIEKHSYKTTSRQLPSMGCADPSNHSAQSDADFIRSQLLLPLIDSGERIFLVMHSYGGMPGSAAAYGLSEEERSKDGLKGGIVGLIYIAAFIVPAGRTCADMKPPPLAGFEMNENDAAIDFDLQKRLVAAAGIERVSTLDTDHSPFLTMPRKTAEILVEYINDFV
ncbi:hypothetical protein P7C71_g1226, partial [Lecanoromycetidae sp. Uapishka_2]